MLQVAKIVYIYNLVFCAFSLGYQQWNSNVIICVCQILFSARMTVWSTQSHKMGPGLSVFWDLSGRKTQLEWELATKIIFHSLEYANA